MLLWSLIACQGSLVHINVEDDVSTTVDSGTLLEQFVGDMGFSDFLNMDITDASELQNQGVEPGDITEANFTQFDLEATDPAGADLSFLDTISLTVEAPSLPAVEFAHAEDFPEGESRVWLTLEDVDMAPYIVSQNMTITTDVSGHRPEQDTVVKAHFILSVGVTTQGAVGQVSSD